MMMKNFFRSTVIFAALAMSIVSCSDENDGTPIVEVNETKSEVTETLTTIAENSDIETTIDSLITDFDQLNEKCFAITYPVTVENGTGEKVTLSSNEELEGLINELWLESSDIQIEFPVVLDYGDNQQVEIASTVALYNAFEECVGDIDEECFEITYPITVSKNEDSENTIIADDESLLTFVDDFSVGDYVEIVYPLSVILKDGTSLDINSDEEFLTLADSCIDN